MSNSTVSNGKKFTEDNYCSRNDILNYYNSSNIDSIYKDVLTYRSFYDIDTDLHDESSSFTYKICLYKNLNKICRKIENTLYNSLLKYVLLPNDLQSEYFKKNLVETLSHFAVFSKNNVTENSLYKLVNEESENIPSNMYMLKAFLDAFNYGFTIKEITIDEIEKINAVALGQDVTSYQVNYRQNEINDVINPLFAPKPERIKDYLNELISFLNAQDEIPTILKALTILYVFEYLRPFELANELTASILAKTYLNLTGFGLIGYSLNFESIVFSTTTSFFDNLKLVESSLDLTYALNRFSSFILNSACTNYEIISRLNISKASRDSSQLSSDNSSNENTLQLALPVFPLDDRNETVEARALKLIQMHPYLKKKQAHFYAGHCTIGMHYTIEQFKEVEHSVYETARTSMEELKNRGFYKKELIGKKFVYTPIPID